jgi:Zn-dependent protease
MKESEILQIIIAIFVLALVIGFLPIVALDLSDIGLAILASFLIIITNIAAKKITARQLDASIENKIWLMSRFGFKPSQSFKKSIPIGLILPLFVTVFTLGAGKIMTIITYETHTLKRRAARRFGHYSFTEMTEFHIALIGAAGIITTLTLSFIAYWIPGLEYVSRAAAFYAFFNLIPFSKLDGSQIFFGSRTLWYSLAIITLIFAVYALVLP